MVGDWCSCERLANGVDQGNIYPNLHVAWLQTNLAAFGSAHAIAHVARMAPKLPKKHLIVCNLSGRGDKDIFTVARHLGTKL